LTYREYYKTARKVCLLKKLGTLPIVLAMTTAGTFVLLWMTAALMFWGLLAATAEDIPD
jgi:hypothetical protein